MSEVVLCLMINPELAQKLVDRLLWEKDGQLAGLRDQIERFLRAC